MAGRALLAGYHRHVVFMTIGLKLIWLCIIQYRTSTIWCIISTELDVLINVIGSFLVHLYNYIFVVGNVTISYMSAHKAFYSPFMPPTKPHCPAIFCIWYLILYMDHNIAVICFFACLQCIPQNKICYGLWQLYCQLSMVHWRTSSPQW